MDYKVKNGCLRLEQYAKNCAERDRELGLGLPDRAGKSYEPLRTFIPLCERDCPDILYFERKFLQYDSTRYLLDRNRIMRRELRRRNRRYISRTYHDLFRFEPQKYLSDEWFL